jgi:hypothetical protein
MHCNKYSIDVFNSGLCGLSPNFHIHVSVSDLYIPRIGPHTSCSRIGKAIVEIYNRSQTHECGNRDCGRAIPFLGILVSNLLQGPRISKNTLFRLHLKLASSQIIGYINRQSHFSGRRKIRKRGKSEVAIMAVLADGDVG